MNTMMSILITISILIGPELPSYCIEHAAKNCDVSGACEKAPECIEADLKVCKLMAMFGNTKEDFVYWTNNQEEFRIGYIMKSGKFVSHP